MKLIPIVSVLCITTIALLLTRVADADVGAPGGASADVAEQVMQLERQRQDAFVRNDLATIDKDTAQDYTTINAAGKMSDKSQMMSNLKVHKTKVISVNLDQMKVRVYGDIAILTGRYQDVGVTEGVQTQSQALFTRIFVKKHGHWEAVAYQQTPIPAQ